MAAVSAEMAAPPVAGMIVLPGHGFAGELCSAVGLGSTTQPGTGLPLALRKPILWSFAFLIVTKYVSWKFHWSSAGLEIA